MKSIPVISFLILIATILLLVILHEIGHWLVAKCMKVKVIRFSIGFGKPVVQWKSKSGTAFSIGWLLVGGYVHLLNSREQQVTENEYSNCFDHKAIWQRVCIILAGPLANLLFAIVAFFVVYVVGIKVTKPIIGEVVAFSPAAQAHLSSGIEITHIQGVKARHWEDVMIQLIMKYGNQGNLLITAKPFLVTSTSCPILQNDFFRHLPEPRNLFVHHQQGKPVSNQPRKPPSLVPPEFERGMVYSIQLDTWKLDTLRPDLLGSLGIKPYQHLKQDLCQNSFRYILQYPFLPALKQAFSDTFLFFKLNTVLFGKIIMGKISLQSLGGPLLLYQELNQAFKQGFLVLLIFLGRMSALLAFINLLPLFGLDGGQLVQIVIEKIRGKSLSVAMEILLTRLGFICLAVLIAHFTMNDLLRFMS